MKRGKVVGRIFVVLEFGERYYFDAGRIIGQDQAGWMQGNSSKPCGDSSKILGVLWGNPRFG
jgi:hypothetical protein